MCLCMRDVQLFFEVLLVILSGSDKQNVNSLHNCLNALFLRVSFVEAVFMSTLFIDPLRITWRFSTSSHSAYTDTRIVKCQKTQKLPAKSTSRNSIILPKCVASGVVNRAQKRDATKHNDFATPRIY